MTTTRELSTFVDGVTFSDLSSETVDELERRVLDAVGNAVAALGDRPVESVYETVAELDGAGSCSLWGRDETASPIGAAMHNTALTRDIGLGDAFLAPSETSHPCDAVAPVLAAAEDEGVTGRELLAALGVAYEVQGELAWNAPVREEGFDHVTHSVLSAACGAASVYDLPVTAIRDAVGIAGAGHNALRVTRTGDHTEWRAVASADAARHAVYACRLAAHGTSGPGSLFQGRKGWEDVVSGEFEVALDPGCSRVHDVMTRKYVADCYAQPAIEAAIELVERYHVDPADVSSIHLDTFAGAKRVLGGGESDPYEVDTRGDALRSLPYTVAVALIDREVTVAQVQPNRIRREDVQSLLQKVSVDATPAYTERFQVGRMPARLGVEIDDGTEYEVETEACEGHPCEPMNWANIEAKFHELTADRYEEDRQQSIVEVVRTLEDRDASELVELLE